MLTVIDMTFWASSKQKMTKKSMSSRIIIITALYIALSLGSCLGQKTDKEIEHCIENN